MYFFPLQLSLVEERLCLKRIRNNEQWITQSQGHPLDENELFYIVSHTLLLILFKESQNQKANPPEVQEM